MNLYWIETEDHSEDWFVVAGSNNSAIQFFAHYEGFDEDDPSAKFICKIPDSEQLVAGWVEEDTLLTLGAVTEDHKGTRVVRLNGVVYTEGLLESIILELDEKLINANKAEC